jgi:hypothetical protein
MRLFQYEREDSSVSIISAENKEEACDLLKEFEINADPNKMLPLRNLLINLAPDEKQGNFCWELDDIGIQTVMELPLLEVSPNKNNNFTKNNNVININIRRNYD